MNKSSLRLKLAALTVLLAAFVFESTVCAQVPFLKRSNSKTAKLNLTQDAGPWLIMRASFDGEDGRQQAINLANELRTKHRFNAYVYRQHFDFASEIATLGKGYQKPTAGGTANLRQREMQLVKQDEKTEYAVLVGNYKSVESPQAQQDLATIKKLQPETLKIYSADVRDTSQAGRRLRADSEAIFGSSDGVKKMTLGNSKFPLKLSLLVINPMIPEDQLAASSVDQYLVRLNEGLKYTLLDNPKAYTLKVASFSGKVFVRQQDIDALKADRNWQRREKQGKNNSSLVQAAKRAKILTEYFRSQNVEAYQFHDRHSSYVCVGGFDWVSEGEGPNARPNPEVEALAKVFAAQPAENGFATFPLPGKLLSAGVTCDANPLTVAVPKVKKQTAKRRSLLR